MKALAFTAAVLLALTSCSPDISQQAHPRPAKQEPAQSAALASQDRDFIERAAQGGNAEIAMGTLVDGRALRPEVIAFGHMLVADHTAANKQLALIAAARHIALPTALGEHQASFDRVVERRLDPFDREFTHVQIGDHQQAIELFKAEATNGSDPDLKAFAAASLPKLEAHLQQATAIAAMLEPMQDLSSPPDAAATQLPPASPPRNVTGAVKAPDPTENR